MYTTFRRVRKCTHAHGLVNSDMFLHLEQVLNISKQNVPNEPQTKSVPLHTLIERVYSILFLRWMSTPIVSIAWWPLVEVSCSQIFQRRDYS